MFVWENPNRWKLIIFSRYILILHKGEKKEQMTFIYLVMNYCIFVKLIILKKVHYKKT